jgi:murein DD-endopeptidase MepM/ murein hydrolase activator NlpD
MARVGLLIVFALGAIARPSAASDVLTPLVFRAVAPPEPVLAADAQRHLVYELQIINQRPDPVAIESIEVLDAKSGTSLLRREGRALDAALRINGGASGARVPGGGSAYLFMDVALPASVAPPRQLQHRIALAVGSASPHPAAGPPRELDAAGQPPPEMTFVGVPVSSDRLQPIAIGPPLRGRRWVVANGCCATITSHRGATLGINGTLFIPERFAIDFVQLDAEARLFSGSQAELVSYAGYGAEVLSVADGVVVDAQDGVAQQVPPTPPAVPSVQFAAGNYLVIDLGGHRFALYAHFQPGTLRVGKGQRVRRGQVLGLLGNSGNTTAPHLHFQVMDAPSPLLSNGLPFVFTDFSGAGVVADEDALFRGDPTPLDRAALAGPHRNELPLNGEVVDFP